MEFLTNNLTLLAGGTTGGLVLWLLKRIPNDKIYDFIERNREVFPTYDSWIEVSGNELEWSEFLNDWQIEELEKQLSE